MSDPHKEGAPPPVPPKPLVPLEIERALGAIALGIIALIAFANVVVRYVTDFSFAFTEEFSVFLLVVLTFVGSAYIAARGEEIRIGLLADGARPPIARLCFLLALLATLAMFGLIAWYGGELAWDEYRFEETSAGLGYPSWIYTVWMPILAVVVMLRLLGRAARRLRGGR